MFKISHLIALQKHEKEGHDIQKVFFKKILQDRK